MTVSLLSGILVVLLIFIITELPGDSSHSINGNDSQPGMNRTKRTLHVWSNEHGRKHADNGWWAMLNHSVRNTLNITEPCYVCSIMSHSAEEPFPLYPVEVPTSVLGPAMAVVTVTAGGGSDRDNCKKIVHSITSSCLSSGSDNSKSLLTMVDPTLDTNCYDNSSLLLHISWCDKLISRKTPQPTPMAQVMPRTAPFTNRTLCWCRGNVAEGRYMGLSNCVTYVHYVKQSTTDLLKKTEMSGSLQIGDTLIQAHPIKLGPGEDGAGTFMNHYWVCGQAVYLSLPKHWFGCCAFVTLNTTMKVFKVNESHKVHKRVKRSQFFSPNNVPLDSRRSGKGDKLAGALFPWFGVGQNAHEIDKVAYELETLTNLTTEGFQIMQPEIRAIRIMVMQNRMVLDMLLAEQGGVCHLVGEHCCTYIPDGDTNLTEVVQHLSTLRERLVNEHAHDTGLDPFSWIQSIFGFWGTNLFHWIIYGLVVIIALMILITCVKKLCTKILDNALTMSLLTTENLRNEDNDPFRNMDDDVV